MRNIASHITFIPVYSSIIFFSSLSADTMIFAAASFSGLFMNLALCLSHSSSSFKGKLIVISKPTDTMRHVMLLSSNFSLKSAVNSSGDSRRPFSSRKRFRSFQLYLLFLPLRGLQNFSHIAALSVPNICFGG